MLSMDILQELRQLRTGTTCSLRIGYAMQRKVIKQIINLFLTRRGRRREGRPGTIKMEIGEAQRGWEGRDPPLPHRRLLSAVSAHLHAGIFSRGIERKMTRLEKLKELEVKLGKEMESADHRTLAPLAKQYRETLREIEELEAHETDENEIEKLLEERESDGKPGAVRTDRSKVRGK